MGVLLNEPDPSILTILAITVERYYAICLPLRAGVVCTKSKACLTCLIAWVSLLFSKKLIELGLVRFSTEKYVCSNGAHNSLASSDMN